jgi:MFS family permease
MALRATKSTPAPDAGMPHPLPAGALAGDISACTFLNKGGTTGEEAYANGAVRRPSNGGRVPRAVYAALFLDMCAVGLVIPLLPSFAALLGGDAAFAGGLQAVYGLAQVAGASLLGGLSDRRGRRPVLRLSLAGGLVGYGVLCVAVWRRLPKWWLLLSRLPIGLTKQTVSVTRAVVVDCTALSERAAALGRLAAAGGLGFVVGPALGGILSAVLSPLAPPLLAVALFACAQLVVCAAVPETEPRALAASAADAVVAATRVAFEAAAGAHARELACRSGGASAAPPPPLRSARGGVLVPVGAAVALADATLRARYAADGGEAGAGLEALVEGAAGALRAAASADELVCSRAFEASLSLWLSEAQEACALTPLGTARARRAREAGGGAGSALGASVGPTLAALRARPSLARLCAVRLLCEGAILTVHNTFPLHAAASLRLSPKAIGYTMTVAAASSVLVDMLVFPRLLRLRALGLRPTGLAGLCLVCAALPWTSGRATTAAQLAAALVVLSAGASLVRTSLAALMLARAADSGAVSGLIDGIESVCRVATPLGGGWLLARHGAWAPGAASGCMAAIALVELLTLELSAPAAAKPAAAR